MTLITKRLNAKLIRNLTDTELKECERCSYGYGGGMCNELRHARKNLSGAQALMIWSVAGKLIGWSLFFEQDRAHGAMFYVPTKHRRNGIGHRLMQAVLRRDAHTYVFPENPTNRKFFARYPTLEYDEYWYGQKFKGTHR